MKRYCIDFAFDDQSGSYVCCASDAAEALDSFELMIEQLAIPIDILRVYEDGSDITTTGSRNSGSTESTSR